MPVAVEPHVPAWKKLGLKLKNASEPAATTPVHGPLSQKKRKLPDGDQQNLHGAESKPTKRVKKSTNTENHAAGSGTTAQVDRDPSSTTSKKPTLRKSVSFAAGAKTEDGESAKDLYNSWLDSQKATDPSFDPSSYNQDALKAITPTTVAVAERDPTNLTTNSSSSKDPQPPLTPKNKKKKKKKRNKSKSTTLPKSTANTNGSITTPAKTLQPTTHPALTYLSTHQTSPKDWKFSKSRSSYLLRHLFSLPHIPASYTPALESYLSGLESRTAIQAIRQRALDIIKEDDEWLDESSNFKGWDVLPDDQSAENEEAKEEVEREEKDDGREEAIKMDDPIKRKEIFLQALKRHRQILRARHDTKEEGEKDRVWQWKVARRKRVEGVLKVLNEHVYGNAEGLQIDKNPPATIQAQPPSTRATANGITATSNGTRSQRQQQQRPPQKGKRKRKRRTTGVPDDDDSSSSSSSSSSSTSDSEPHDDGARMAKRAKRIRVLEKKVRLLKGEEGSSGSESESDESSSSSSSSERG
ncbi:MAG: hypothetical protein LQ349_005500 [Xanthoria aureola]|nr:MAG: hypothetical protein LQ349_005500 [Xanthoria aureola]